VIAFVLAFLFRTFEAEAFVIPTGSMAPTLVGRHRDVRCTQCDYEYKVSASEEVREDAAGTILLPHETRTHSVCPNCQFVNRLADGPAFKGDRILVLKFPYRMPGAVPPSWTEPQRWDVVVFKYPEDPQTNYIKRLVGLPHEKLQVHYGDIYTQRDGGPFEIARKPARKQEVMRMLVHDNNHPARDWQANGWPARWHDASESPGWQPLDGGRAFECRAGVADDHWSRLSYRHLVLVRESSSAEATPRAALVTDEYGYNGGMSESEFERGLSYLRNAHWVGDLALSLRVDVAEARGRLQIELVEAGEPFRCLFDLGDGSCRLLRGDAELASAFQVLRGPGRYRLEFSNIDDRLTVAVNGILPFGDGVDYAGIGLDRTTRPTTADLEPVAVMAAGASVRISDLVVYRDIYYTQARMIGDAEYALSASELSDPEAWQRIAENRPLGFPKLDADQFMMMGDNSPKSRDSRLWTDGAAAYVNDLPELRELPYSDQRAAVERRPGGDVLLAPKHVVHRQLLIGKAFYVYWPHGEPFDWSVNLLGSRGDLRVPFVPQWSRMKLVR
jgi:signal peptidase I